jgi:Cupin
MFLPNGRYMTYGSWRVTVLDPEGHAYGADVNEGDIWYFPAGYPHSLQGLGPDGAEFILAFDDGHASEFNTLLVTDWIPHTHRISWRRIFVFQPRRFRKHRYTISTFFRATCRDHCPRIRQPCLAPKAPQRTCSPFL